MAVVAVILCGMLTSAAAQEASPVAGEMGPPAGVQDETLAFGAVDVLPATPAFIFLDRLTIDPGAAIPGSPGDPTFAFVRVESGTLTFRADAPLQIVRGAALTAALATPGTLPAMEETAAETNATLQAGDSIVFPPMVGVELRNDGTEPAVLLGAVIASAEAMMGAAQSTPAP
jgi:hypothetical protein